MRRRKLDLETAPAPSVGWRPKADWGDKVRLTNKGLEGQRGNTYYFDEDGNTVDTSTGRKGHIALDETYVTPLQTYTLDTDGNKTIGRDPLGVFRNDKPLERVYPEYDLLSLFGGFSNLASKANKPLYSVGNKLSSFENKVNSAGNTSATNNLFNFGIDKTSLPSYVNFAKGKASNPFELHLSRLRNGKFKSLDDTDRAGNYVYIGFDRHGEPVFKRYKAIERDPDNINIRIYDFNKDKRKALDAFKDDLESVSGYRKTYTDQEAIGEFPFNSPLFATSSRKNIYIAHDPLHRFNLSDRIKQIFKSHELDHAVHIPTEQPKGFNLGLFKQSYFRNGNGTELAARGSQLKDWFGFDKDMPITEDMLKYAAENYTKSTGVDNNMTDFFNSITDWKEAAKWLSKYATAYGSPIGIGYGAHKNNK